MSKYKVIKNFTDKYDLSRKYKIGEVVEFENDRAKEILSVGKLIEKINEPKKTDKQSEE